MTKTIKRAKVPEKPSGKANVLGNTQPYKEPKVLGPTAKVKSVGPILGGKPKKNPTLTTKFFGTCSANNDPGNKTILDEGMNEIKKLKSLGPNKGAALILPNNKVYLSKAHWKLRVDLNAIGVNTMLSNGTVRIRYAGTEGFDTTVIEFENDDKSTLDRVFAALDIIETPGDLFRVEYTSSTYPWKTFYGTSEVLKDKINSWMNTKNANPEPRYSSDLNYWRGESSINNAIPLQESIQLTKLNKLSNNEDYGAALIFPNGNIYVGDSHYYLGIAANLKGDNASLSEGTIRVRYAGTAGFDRTTIEFKLIDKKTIDRVIEIINFIAKKYHGVFDVECTGIRFRGMTGTPEEVKLMLERLLRGYEKDQAHAKPQYSSVMNFWRESKENKKKTIGESINYKSFKNASKAVTKTCPACNNTFKNISDQKQNFCSQQCEEDGGLTLKLQEAFKRF